MQLTRAVLMLDHLKSIIATQPGPICRRDDLNTKRRQCAIAPASISARDLAAWCAISHATATPFVPYPKPQVMPETCCNCCGLLVTLSLQLLLLVGLVLWGRLCSITQVECWRL